MDIAELNGEGLTGKCVDARWCKQVAASFPKGAVLFSRGIADYQGQCAIVAKLDDGRFVHYDWSYGSCSGCDRWDGKAGYDYDSEEKEQAIISKDVLKEAAFMDAETFADYLIGCLGKNAEWLTGKIHYGKQVQDSYSYALHTGMTPEELLAAVIKERK